MQHAPMFGGIGVVPSNAWAHEAGPIVPSTPPGSGRKRAITTRYPGEG